MVDGRGHVYVNGVGFNPVAGESFQPGPVFLAGADGSVRQVTDDITFPNGMAVTGDNSALIVADSYRHNLVAFDISADGGLSGRRARTDHATHRGRRTAGHDRVANGGAQQRPGPRHRSRSAGGRLALTGRARAGHAGASRCLPETTCVASSRYP